MQTLFFACKDLFINDIMFTIQDCIISEEQTLNQYLVEKVNYE